MKTERLNEMVIACELEASHANNSKARRQLHSDMLKLIRAEQARRYARSQMLKARDHGKPAHE